MLPVAFREYRPLFLASACLVGIPCRFDGQSCPEPAVVEWATRGQVILLCPEVLGGLPIPRPAAEIEGAHAGLDGHAVIQGRTRVLCRDRADVTDQFLRGAQAALGLAQHLGIQRAILKSRSPSCGVGRIYDGSFTGALVPGHGVTAALLEAAGIQVHTEEDLGSEL